MIIFWLVCGIFVAIALAFVLPPLLQRSDKRPDEDSSEQANLAVYRDQIAELDADLRNGIISREQYPEDRDEIERRLLEDITATGKGSAKHAGYAAAGRAPVYGVVLALTVIAVALYLRVGNPDAISASQADPGQSAFAPVSQGDPQFTKERMEANVAALAKRLEQNSGDLQGWIMLARSYSSLEKYSDATAAYAKATALKTDDADLWAEYAFATAMTNGRRLQGRPLEFIAKALNLDPENPRALELAGSAAFEAKNYKQAIDYWQKLLQKTPPASEVGQALSQRIAEARTLSAEAR